MAFEEFVVVCFSGGLQPSPHQLNGAGVFTRLPEVVGSASTDRSFHRAHTTVAIAVHEIAGWADGNGKTGICARNYAGREGARVIGVAGEPWEGMGSSPAFAAPPSELEGSARRDDWIHAGHAAALVLARIA